MSFTVFLGNLPTWVTADDIKQWLAAEDLVADAVKVIRNHETQESKGFAFVEAPTSDEMQAIIRRFDRAPLEDRLLRANPAQPPKGKDARTPQAQQQSQPSPPPQQAMAGVAPNATRNMQPRPERRKRGGRDREQTPRSAFATELAKVL
jgi:RNA recognition motif-containing protein